MWALVHELAPPGGSVAVTTFPPASTATHSRTEGHDTAFRAWPLIRVIFQLEAYLGLLETNAFPN
jgi:hypothetical protein